MNGIISALTHLNVLEPSQARKDTLAYVYMNNNQHVQALKLLGVEANTNDSDLAVQVKAISLKSLNETQRALQQFEILYQREKNPLIAYELADLQIQLGANDKAQEFIDYGLSNATDGMTHAFFERQQPYQVSLKAAFTHLNALVLYKKNPEKNKGCHWVNRSGTGYCT